MVGCKRPHVQLLVKDGVGELGYFRKDCLDLIQISRLCPPNPAVGGDHNYIFGTSEMSFMSSASALAARKPNHRCLKLPMTSTGNNELCYELCHGAGHVTSRCLCGICPVASLGFPCGLWGLFLYFTSGVCCSASILTTSPCNNSKATRKTSEFRRVLQNGQKEFAERVNTKYLRLKDKLQRNFVYTGKMRTCNFSSVSQISLIILGSHMKE